MREIISSIKNLYGIEMGIDDFNSLLLWYKLNSRKIDETNFKGELEVYLSEKYGEIILNEEDTSNLSYLLSLIREYKKK